MIRAEKEKNRSSKHLLYKMSSCIREYKMIKDGDRVLICFSGGKDSFALFKLLKLYRKNHKTDFSLSVLHVDHMMPDFPINKLDDYLKTTNIDFKTISQDIYGTVNKKMDGEKACSLCSRLRRGVIYKYAEENGFNRIAMGHHMDDIVETLFLNMFYGSRMKAIPPVLFSKNRNFSVIRPLSTIREYEIGKLVCNHEFPVIEGDYCGMLKNRERQMIKKMLNGWQKEFPGRVEKIYSSIKNIEPSLLSDSTLYNFFES